MGDIVKVNVLFALQLEVEIDKSNDYDLDDIDMKIMEKLDTEDYELELMGYFEDRKVKADLKFKVYHSEPKAIMGVSTQLY